MLSRGFWVFGVFGREGADEVAADAYFGLDGGASAEDYVLCAVELGFARYFVAGVGFDVVAFWLGGGGFGGHWGVGRVGRVVRGYGAGVGKMLKGNIPKCREIEWFG